jgi:putative membrane protein
VDEKAKKDADEYRVRVQAEITLLVWVRTSLGLMGFGFVIARFGLFLREIARVGEAAVARNARLAQLNGILGTALMVLGVVALLTAVFLYRRFIDRLERGELQVPSRWSPAVILSLILAGLGAWLALYLTFIEI